MCRPAWRRRSRMRRSESSPASSTNGASSATCRRRFVKWQHIGFNRALAGTPERRWTRSSASWSGAGVVGLAAARALALAGREVLVLEAEDLVGSQTSSRNSEVIHAGIYYPQGSAKARLCVQGRERLYAFCADRGVPYRRLGKIIVATGDDQRGRLAGIAAAAVANGVDRPAAAGGGGPRGRSSRRSRGRRPPLAVHRDRRQPRLHAGAAGRGRGARGDGGAAHPRHGGTAGGASGFEVTAEGGGAVTRLRARWLVNAAGLGAGRGGGGDRGAGAGAPRGRCTTARAATSA